MGAFHQAATGDLADFLRTSGPPVTAPAPVVGRGVVAEKVKPKRRGLFGLLNGKSKDKGAKKTWLDMP
jgi:hypothetical protein